MKTKRLVSLLLSAAALLIFSLPVAAVSSVSTVQASSQTSQVSSSADTKKSSSSGNSDIVKPRHIFSYSVNQWDDALLGEEYYYKTDNAYLRDEAEIFFGNNDALLKKLEKDVQQTADEIGMNVAIFLGGLRGRNDSLTEKFAAYGSERLFGTKWDDNSIFLYLDFEESASAYDYIDTYHDAKLYYTDDKSGVVSRVEDLLDALYDYLPSSGKSIHYNKIYQAIEAYLKQLKKIHEKGPQFDSCYYNQEKGCYRWMCYGRVIDCSFSPYRGMWLFFLIAVGIGLTVGFAGAASIRKKYKFRESASAAVYTSKNRCRITNQQDIFLREHTTKTKIESSSGGHGGGHSHHGGGSHGGGGRHR